MIFSIFSLKTTGLWSLNSVERDCGLRFSIPALPVNLTHQSADPRADFRVEGDVQSRICDFSNVSGTVLWLIPKYEVPGMSGSHSKTSTPDPGVQNHHIFWKNRWNDCSRGDQRDIGLFQRVRHYSEPDLKILCAWYVGKPSENFNSHVSLRNLVKYHQGRKSDWSEDDQRDIGLFQRVWYTVEPVPKIWHPSYVGKPSENFKSRCHRAEMVTCQEIRRKWLIRGR